MKVSRQGRNPSLELLPKCRACRKYYHQLIDLTPTALLSRLGIDEFHPRLDENGCHGFMRRESKSHGPVVVSARAGLDAHRTGCSHDLLQTLQLGRLRRVVEQFDLAGCDESPERVEALGAVSQRGPLNELDSQRAERLANRFRAVLVSGDSRDSKLPKDGDNFLDSGGEIHRLGPRAAPAAKSGLDNSVLSGPRNNSECEVISTECAIKGCSIEGVGVRQHFMARRNHGSVDHLGREIATRGLPELRHVLTAKKVTVASLFRC